MSIPSQCQNSGQLPLVKRTVIKNGTSANGSALKTDDSMGYYTLYSTSLMSNDDDDDEAVLRWHPDGYP